MSKIAFQKQSVFFRLFSVLFLVSIILILLYVCAIERSGIVNQLRGSKIDIIDNIVETRKNTIENQMVAGWADYESMEGAITELENLKDAGSENEVQVKRAEILLNLLGNTSGTGIFYVPLEENDKNGYDTLYFRDLNPEYYSRTNADIYGEYGNAAIMKTLGITMDSNWKAYADKDMLANSYITRPVDAYRENGYGEEKDYGCWTVGTLPYYQGLSCIMYTIPLLGDDGQVFAVLGIEISMEYINTFLKYNELTLEESSTYVLGVCDERTGEITPVTAAGPEYKSEIMKQKSIRLTQNDRWDNISEIDGFRNGRELVFRKDIVVYNVNTPFADEHWCLLAIQNEDRLFQNENRFQHIIIMVTILAVFVAVAGSYLGSRNLGRPIMTVYHAVSNMKPMKNLAIRRVNIIEIDSLSEAIEEMGRDIIRSASRMASIIKDADLKVGVIELDEEKALCYMTYSCCNILQMEQEEKDYLLMSAEELKEMLRQFYAKASLYKGVPVNDFIDNNTYEMIDRNDQSRWITFSTKVEEKKILMVISDVTENITREMKLEYEVSHDALSGLLNNKAFCRQVQKRLIDNEGKTGAMIMWDLDNLKYVNDTYGHEYGDMYIRMAAKCLGTLEQQGGIVSRRSGDEFYAYIDGDSREELYRIIRELHKTLGQQTIILPNREHLKLRGSAGIAWYSKDASNYDELIKKADFTMYTVKHSNKGRIAEFSQEEYQRDEILVSGNEDLNKFIENKLLKLAYQPIVDVHTGEIFAYEALMRPKMEKLKTPFDVIRLAKSQSRLMDIEVLTWETTLEDYFIHKNGGNGKKLFVNSFPNAVLSKESEQFCKEHFGQYFNRVVVEMTENEEMNDIYMERKRAAGGKDQIEFALDDFGSGFNFEIKIIEVRPSYVKIDKSFVENIVNDPYRQEMVKNTIDYCKRHNIHIIAEGVETREELDYMKQAGVDYIQGYYLARPEETLPDEEKMEEIRRKAKYE